MSLCVFKPFEKKIATPNDKLFWGLCENHGVILFVLTLERYGKSEGD